MNPHEIEKKILDFKHKMMKYRANLESLGYQFEYPDQVLREPDPHLEEKIAFLEKRIGPMPLALKVFYKHIGCINFQGSHPDWEEIYADAVWIDSIDSAIEELECQDLEEQGGKFYYPIAPDYFHKEGESGGMFYRIELPSDETDPLICFDVGETMSFLDYLALCIQWGGFPRLRKYEETDWPLGEIKK